jgi:hypothetical protein
LWFFPHSRLIAGFVTRLTRRVPLVKQELPTLPEYLSSPPVVSAVRVTRSLVLYVCFVDRCLSFCTFYFGHCVVCSSSIYGFSLPLWYLQTLLINLKWFDLGQDLKVEPELPRYPFFYSSWRNSDENLEQFFLPTFMYKLMLSDAKKTHLTLWVSWAKNSKRSIGQLDSVVSSLSSKSSDRKCLVNIRDILKRYF